MNEKKKHKIMLGIEVVLLCMIAAILGTNAASSNPPSNGVSYNKNNQATVEVALNDLYTKANYGNATASQILKGKTALVGGKQVTGTMEDRGLTQYGGWGCGDLGCGSGDDAYYSINGLPEGYYHSDGNWWAPEARINANTLRASLGITADKIVKGQSIAGVSGTGETGYSSCSSCCPTCPTCEKCPTLESQGYVKYWKFDKDATYTRTSTGTDTTLSSGSWSRFCADNKECTYTFKVPLDSGIEVNKLYSCDVHLRTKGNGPGGKSCIDTGGAHCSVNGFRTTRGYASNSTTVQYRYMDELTASTIYGDRKVGSYTSYGTWSNGGYSVQNSTTSAAGSAKTVCNVSGSNIEMTLEINDMALSTYDSNFVLSGSITYQ